MFAKIAYYQIFGISLITYLGILAFLIFAATALVAIRSRRGSRLLFKWHHRLATIAIIVAFIHGMLGLLGRDTVGYGMAGSGQDKESQQSSLISHGADIFNAHCRTCHPNGGNIINPYKPIKGSQRLTDFETFLAFIRKPTSPMPSFSQETITDKQAKELYTYITSE
jgi:mono/diheme cytochrome c family protein